MDTLEQHTCVRDGIHRVSGGVKVGMDAVSGPQMGPQEAEITVFAGSLTVRPDMTVVCDGRRTAAHRGE